MAVRGRAEADSAARWRRGGASVTERGSRRYAAARAAATRARSPAPANVPASAASSSSTAARSAALRQAVSRTSRVARHSFSCPVSRAARVCGISVTRALARPREPAAPGAGIRAGPGRSVRPRPCHGLYRGPCPGPGRQGRAVGGFLPQPGLEDHRYPRLLPGEHAFDVLGGAELVDQPGIVGGEIGGQERTRRCDPDLQSRPRRAGTVCEQDVGKQGLWKRVLRKRCRIRAVEVIVIGQPVVRELLEQEIGICIRERASPHNDARRRCCQC